MSWTPEERQFVKDNFLLMTRAKLADALNKKFGISRSRNSVIGIITRMGLATSGRQPKKAAKTAKKAKPGKPTGDSKRLLRPITQHAGLPPLQFGSEAPSRGGVQKPPSKRQGSLASRRRAALEASKVITRNLTLIDLGRNDCRFATAHDGVLHRFCGAPQIEGFSYCAHHALRTISMDEYNIRHATKLVKRTEAMIDEGCFNV